MRRIALTLALLSFSLAAFAQESAPAPADAAPAAAPAEAAASAADAATAAAPAEAAAPAAASTEAAPTAAPATAPAASPVAVNPPTLGTPADGTAQIVFFRPWKFAGGGVNFKVREGDTELGKLSAGKYFIVDVAPGTHSYAVHSETKDVLELEVEAGETYYVKGGISMGVLVGRPNISPSNEGEFAAAQKKLKRVASELDMAAQAARSQAAATAAEGTGANGS